MFKDNYLGMVASSEGNLSLLEQFSQDLGIGKVKPYAPLKRGAGDISFVSEHLSN